MLKQRLGAIIANTRFEYFILVLITINAIVLGMETSEWIMSHIGPFLLAIDALILWVFVSYGDSNRNYCNRVISTAIAKVNSFGYCHRNFENMNEVGVNAFYISWSCVE